MNVKAGLPIIADGMAPIALSMFWNRKTAIEGLSGSVRCGFAVSKVVASEVARLLSIAQR
jgi:hypothetical protein